MKDLCEQARGKALEAEADKYAPGSFDRAEEYYNTALDLLDEGSTLRARSRFSSARRQYEKAAQEAPKNKKRYALLEKKKKQVERLREKARKLGAETLARQLYEDALTQLKAASENLASGTNLLRVESILERAKGYFNDAIAEVERKKKEEERLAQLKRQAEEEKKIMLQKQKLAKEAGAETKRAAEFGYANDTARDGDRFFQQKDYEMALEQYRAAKAQYLQIIQSIEAEKKFAATTTAAPPVSGARPPKLAPPEEPGLSPQPQPGLAPPRGLAAPQQQLKGYAALLASNLEKLLSGVASYEGGKATVDYSDGSTVKKDAFQAAGFIRYKKEILGQEQSISFTGGAQGALFLKPVFLKEVTVSFDCHIDLLDPGGFLVAQVMRTRRTGYGSLFGVYAGVVRGMRMVKRMPTTYPNVKGAPKNWVDRKKEHHWELRVKWPKEAKAGQLEVLFDGELVSKYPNVRTEKGWVGFTWYKTRFIVTNLKIQGVLDPKWAIETLEKAGVTVSDDVKVEVGLKKPKRHLENPFEPESPKKKGSKKKNPSTQRKKAGKEVDF